MNKNNTLEDKVSKEPDKNNESTITNPPVNDDVVLKKQMDNTYTAPPSTIETLGGCSFRWADIEEDDEF